VLQHNLPHGALELGRNLGAFLRTPGYDITSFHKIAPSKMAPNEHEFHE